MKLLIDIGNSRMKWAFAADGALQETAAALHGGSPAALIQQLPARPVDAIWLAHVTGADHEAAIEEALRVRYGAKPKLARATAQWQGLRNAYREPERLGIDRWLAMIAAWRETAGRMPACVVDAGTALTADVIAADGQHLGGIITAGLETQQRAVLSATRFATRRLDADYGEGFGNDTESCVHQGALFACVGAIAQAQSLSGPQAYCYLSGGDAGRLLPHLGKRWSHRPFLVLEGLSAVSENV